MGLLSWFSGLVEPRRVYGGAFRERCAICNKPMEVIRGASVGRLPFDHLKGGFECEVCGAVSCHDCSDLNVPCKCGANAWMEREYQGD